MSSDTARTPPRRPYHLLLWFVGLLAIALAGIAVLGIFDTTWSLGLALLLAAVTAVGALREIRAVLADGDATAVRAPARRSALAFGSVAAVAILLAVVVGRDDASGADTATPDAAAAAQTVRDFLALAVIDHNDYLACQYLSADEQARVTKFVPDATSCRDALTQTPAGLGGVTSVGGLHQLKLRTVVGHGRGWIAVSGPHTRPLRFTLRRATAADLGAFEAPDAAWRITSGVRALLAAPNGGRLPAGRRSPV